MRSCGGLGGAWLSCAVALAAAIIGVGSPGIFRWSAAIQSLLPLRAQLGQDLTTENSGSRTLGKKDAGTEGCVTLKRGKLRRAAGRAGLSLGGVSASNFTEALAAACA
jgi:hypothetical protein